MKQLGFEKYLKFGQTPYPENRPGYTDNDTSKAASNSVAPTLAGRQREVLKTIAYLGQSTIDFLCIQMDKTPNQISGRFTELKKMGYIADTGQRKTTRTGCKAKVWAVTIEGAGALHYEHSCAAKNE